MSIENQLPTNQYIAIEPTSGNPRLQGRGIKVEFLVGYLDYPEYTVEYICEMHEITPDQLHAAWLYYGENREALEQRWAERNARIEAYRRMYPEDDQKRDEMIKRWREKQKASGA